MPNDSPIAMVCRRIEQATADAITNAQGFAAGPQAGVPARAWIYTYNPHGQVLQSVDANGLVTDFTYDLRQRLTSVTVAGLTTTYTYEPTGLLQRVTQPDASFVEYHYDAAHRLVALSDASGNRIEYTLDNAGNRVAEQVKDPSGALARQLSRSIDALGRVQQTTGGLH